MKDTSPPEPQAALADLAPLVPVLYQAYEGAAFLAHNYFAQRNRPVDLWHHASIVRYEAKVMLEEHGLPLEDLANNGLALTYAGYNLRAFKADQGRVPSPGTSKTKQRFFQQFRLTDLPESLLSFAQAQQGRWNLVVVWDVTPTYALADLVLALPKYGDADRASVEMCWEVPIPHPATTTTAATSRTAGDDGLEDLPLTLLVDKQRHHGQAE